MSVEAYQIGYTAGLMAIGFVTGYIKGCRKNGKGISDSCQPDTDWTCKEHSGLVKAINGLESGMTRVHAQLDQINQNQMELIKLMGRD